MGGQSGIRVCNGGGGGGASVAPQAHLRIPCVNNLRYRVSSHVTCSYPRIYEWLRELATGRLYQV